MELTKYFSAPLYILHADKKKQKRGMKNEIRKERRNIWYKKQTSFYTIKKVQHVLNGIKQNKHLDNIVDTS